MITRCFRVCAQFSANAPVMMRGFSTATPKKDYYDILGLNKDAEIEEIKNAYRNLAKKFHPDVNASGDHYQGDAQKFRDVVEAYQVLSIQESRTAYDLKNQAAPDFIYRAQRMETLRKFTDRNKDGNLKKENYPAGSYAEQKRQFLADERKKFNVNHLGRYKGGVPQKGKGGKRGTAFDSPGAFHDPIVHNLKINPNPDSQFVTSRDALAFKAYMQEDRYGLSKKWTYFQATVDYDFFKFETYRYGLRYFRNFCLVIFGLSSFAHIIVKAENRSVAKQVEKLNAEGKLAEGTKINGRVVIRGPTGILRYE